MWSDHDRRRATRTMANSIRMQTLRDDHNTPSNSKKNDHKELITMHAIETLNKASILEAALYYHAMGWRVIPLIDKRPITPWTTDPKYNTLTIETMFSTPCNFNLGIAMGNPSQLIAFDIDGEAGQNTLRIAIQNEKERHDVYNTLSFMTPNKGLRLLYQYAPGIPSRSLRYQGHEALRIMSDGTQTVMPPSTIDGRPYEWLASETLAPCPTEVIERLLANQTDHRPTLPPPIERTNSSDAYRRAVKYVRACEPAITGQLGGTRTFKICVRLVQGFQLNYHQAMNIMMEEFNTRCQPEWTEAEMARKVEEALASTAQYKNML